MSLKIFLNEMSFRQGNALRFNWKKIDQYIFNLSLYMWKIQKVCYICQYKGIVNLERVTITAEPLLKTMAYQPLLLRWMNEGIKPWSIMELNVLKSPAWLLIILFWLDLLQKHESELIFAFPLLTSVHGLFERLLFCLGQTQEISVFSE